MLRKEQSLKEIINRLTEEKMRLEEQVMGLKYIINDIQSINNMVQAHIEKKAAVNHGCIVIEGSRTSATYKDLVGILLANDYVVELTPMDGHRKLKVVIKESEV